MNDINQIIEELINISKKQSDSINKLAEGFEQLGQQLQERPTKGESKRYAWLISAATLILVGALIIITTVMAINDRNTHRVEISESTTQILCNEDKIMYYLTSIASNRELPVYKVHPNCVDIIELQLGIDIPEEKILSASEEKLEDKER